MSTIQPRYGAHPRRAEYVRTVCAVLQATMTAAILLRVFDVL